MTEQDPQVGGDRSGTDRTGVDRPAGGRDGGPARGGSGRGGSGRDGGERGGYGRSDRGGGGDRSGSGRGAGRDRDGAGRGGSGRDGAERGGRDAGGRGGTGRSGSDRGRPGGADRGGHGRGDHDGRDHGGRDGRGRDGAGRGGSGWSDRGRSGSADRGGSGRGDRGGADRGGRAGAGRADGDRGGSGGGFGRSDRGGPRGGAGRGGFDRSDRGGPGDRSGSGRGRPDGRAGSDRPGSDRPGHDRPGHDRSGHDRSGGDVARGRTRPDDRGRTPDRGRPDDRGPRRTDRDAARGGRTGAGPRNAGPPRGRVGPGRPPSVDQARLAAYELLTAVRERDAYANLALPGILRRLRLRDRDAALATELGYGTLRAQGLLDAVIDACTDRPLSKIEHPLLDALRLGAYQLLRTRVPPHAAVDTCVELVRGEAGSRSAGFVNAVLRRIGEHDEAAWLDRLAPDPAEDPVGSAALRHAHPVWIARAFADALGTTGDELVEALAADDTRPVVHLLARPGDISAEELALTTGGEPAPFSPYGVHLEPGAGDVGELEPVADGLALVQDEGSQLAALALTRAEPTGPDGGRWLDLCAGPGGKTALLGGVAQLSGATVDAVEVAEHRAELVRAAVGDLPVTVHTADGRSAPLPDDTFDRVLVDAPCTGLGALRRRPEARWRRGPEDITELATLQRELLLAGLRHVRPGGVVAYVTCSPHLSETVGVLARALRRGTPLAEVERLDVRAALPEGMPGLGDGPTVQLWPHRHGTDAMFIALLRRPTG